jgi:nitrous oxide reductase accessory protein NosL
MSDNTDSTDRPSPRDHAPDASAQGHARHHAHQHDHGHRHRFEDAADGDGVTRRRVIQTGAAITGTALAGCLGNGGGGDVPEPIALTADQQCDVCGMVIEKHPGPDGQIFFRDNAPQGHDNPARFDALKQCMFPYLWEKQSLGWKASAIYVTDYSSVDFNVNTQGGNAYMSSHPEKEAFAEAQDLYYVVNSDVQGAMGYDFMPFSVESDATAYAEEWGGQVVQYGDIDEALVGK